MISSDSGFGASLNINMLEKRKIPAYVVNQTLVIKFVVK